MWLAPRPAAACDCKQLTPLDAATIASYDAVFEGTLRGGWRSGDERQRRFSVRRVWRGEIGSRVTILTDDWRIGCGYPFKVGGTYLVFARRHKDGTLQVACTHTTPIGDAEDELAALGEGGVPSSDAGCHVGERHGAWMILAPLLLLTRRRRVASGHVARAGRVSSRRRGPRT